MSQRECSSQTADHLKQLYPNSFDRLGSLRGEYDIKIDPNIAPVAQARRKVPIESREPIEAEIEFNATGRHPRGAD